MAEDGMKLVIESGRVSPCIGTGRIGTDAASEASTDFVSASVGGPSLSSLSKSNPQMMTSWEKQLQSADERQEQLLDFKWNLVREQMGAHAQEISLLQQELHALRVDWSQTDVNKEDHIRRVREMELQVQTEMSVASAHRRDLESNVNLAMTSISEECQASLRSLQTDMTERREALERATRNFSVAEERIGSAFKFLSELNLVVEDEKKQRALCFDGLGKDLRALRIAHEDEAAKTAGREEQLAQEANALAGRLEDMANSEVSLRQIIQDVSSQVYQEEKARILALSKQEASIQTEMKVWQEGMEDAEKERRAGITKEMQGFKAELFELKEQMHRIQTSILPKLKQDVDLAVDTTVQCNAKVSEERLQREELQTLLTARFHSTESTDATAPKAFLARLEALERQSSEELRHQIAQKFKEENKKGAALEEKLLDLMSKKFQEQQAMLSQNVEDLRSQVRTMRLEMSNPMQAIEGNVCSGGMQDSDKVLQRLMESEGRLRAEFGDWRAVQEQALMEQSGRLEVLAHTVSRAATNQGESEGSAERFAELASEYSTRLSALEAKDRNMKSENVAELGARLSTLESQDSEMHTKIREDRNAMLVCCQALEAKLDAESGDYKESVEQVQQKQRACLIRLDELQRSLTEQANKSASQESNMNELIVAGCAQELAHIQQVVAKESERLMASQKALQQDLKKEHGTREEEYERLRVYLTRDRAARDAENAAILARMNTLASQSSSVKIVPAGESADVKSMVWPSSQTPSLCESLAPSAREQHGFTINDQITWKKTDQDVPKGTLGIVVGFLPDRVRVKFPKGTYNMRPDELVKVLDGAQLAAAPRNVSPVPSLAESMPLHLQQAPLTPHFPISPSSVTGNLPSGVRTMSATGTTRPQTPTMGRMPASPAMAQSKSQPALGTSTESQYETASTPSKAIPEKFGLSRKDEVMWTQSDDDVPTGSRGSVVGFTDDRVQVQFGSEIYNFRPVELTKVVKSHERWRSSPVKP
jgi:hypothetical protein